MTFAYPYLLLFLVPIAIWFVWSWRRTTVKPLKYPSLRGFEVRSMTWTRYLHRLPLMLRVLAIILVLLAAARPQEVEHEVRKSGEGLDILLTIDTSGSMKQSISYQGQWVSRLAAAKAVVGNFIEKRIDDRMGLVVFGENAFTQAPLTLDHDVLKSFVDNIYLRMAGDGTAIGSAIITSVKRMKDLESKSKIVILLTDGQDTVGKVGPQAAASAARDLGVKIYTVGIGDRRSRDLDEPTLKMIAQTTGGQYFRAANVENLIEVYETINQLEKSRVEVKDFSRYHEKHESFLIPGLLLLALELLFQLSRWRVVA
ncbi:vWA domain-containing protein [Pseudobacteriovorax antillogorgiicola]|uniref:Ca-activated chloride channel family protein n=1 Tax=Pseudobacteriovorax antillogorgiicola TaxID=1513793 RepID=A0A1Y6BWT0_9BACT|nr:VWA domain-containing protein [Pseudobacteriovorax antillogorgiicola]TCS53159.1 Ca-activated chloride channel family protein [Pseudobacteriovorax antillogorgiicola]SMF25096.1 Ca-activated chloride channel family protein [Pseudobacteriovorax antillogorgiicola]